jgi:hypothetical protein
MEYEYVEEWVPKNENEGTLKIKEVLPDLGQSKNNVRSLDYDCSKEDLVKGLENLEKATKNCENLVIQEKKKIENIKKNIADNDFVLEPTDEMIKIMNVINNFKLIDDLRSAETSLFGYNEELDKHFKRVSERKKILG